MDPNESWSDYEVFIDDKDVVYTMDRKRLLYSRKGFTDNEYFVPEETLTICDQAFQLSAPNVGGFDVILGIAYDPPTLCIGFLMEYAFFTSADIESSSSCLWAKRDLKC